MKNTSIVLVLVVLVLSGCGSDDKREELAQLKKKRDEISQQISKLEAELVASGNIDSAAQDRKATMVNVATVQESPFVHYIKVQGRVVSDKNIMLSAKTAGTIKKIYVDEGQAVKQGQILAQIDPELLNRSMEELRTSLDLATTLYERQKNLWEQNIGTEIQYLQAKNNKEALESRIASLNEQLQQTKIIAPFSGVVDQVSIREGEVAAPNTPAIRIVSPTGFKVRAEIAENYMSVIQVDKNVLVELPNYKDKIPSKVATVSRVIDPAHRTFQVEVSLPDSISESVKANMVTYINVEDYRNATAVVVPINAVQFTDDGSDYVFVAENGKAVMRPIKIGKTYNSEAEVLSGLGVGDKIIVTGHRNLVNEQAIAFNEEGGNS